ncbi:hypothetical protein HMPREF1982_03759 [Clostridiales bacterium oral taxon 876 str. F0540]|nr:hypothetical protein HMPREF1982_03759 [Clostridiales bacterium oral taxon 876 str. F0540]
MNNTGFHGKAMLERGVIMKNNYKSKRIPERSQFKSLNPKDEVEINSIYYGNDEGIATQIVTNYNYKPNND